MNITSRIKSALDSATKPLNGRGFRVWSEGDPVADTPLAVLFEYAKALGLFLVLSSPVIAVIVWGVTR